MIVRLAALLAFAARAGATFQVASISGAFHGEMSTQTPAGSHVT